MDRVQCVGIGSALSDFVLNVVSGVPQGSVLGHVPVTNTTLQYAALDISAQSSYVRSYLCFFYLNKVFFAVLDVPPLPLQ